MKKGAYYTAFFIFFFVVGIITLSCGSDHAGSTGQTGAYLTGLSAADSEGENAGFGERLLIGSNEYSQATMTVKTIQLVNSGTGDACSLVTVPSTDNLADLTDSMRLEDVEECPSGPYNRIVFQFADTVQLSSSETGSTSSCRFVSYKDTGSSSQPNILLCEDGICTINMNGAVNVLANENNKMALGFDFKEFVVSEFGSPECAITMKVSPLNSSQMSSLGRLESIEGVISNLDVTNKSFVIVRGNTRFLVFYAEIFGTSQSGLDVFLGQAEEDGLQVRVLCRGIDLQNRSITATQISIEVGDLVLRY